MQDIASWCASYLSATLSTILLIQSKYCQHNPRKLIRIVHDHLNRTKFLKLFYSVSSLNINLKTASPKLSPVGFNIFNQRLTVHCNLPTTLQIRSRLSNKLFYHFLIVISAPFSFASRFARKAIKTLAVGSSLVLLLLGREGEWRENNRSPSTIVNGTSRSHRSSITIGICIPWRV